MIKEFISTILIGLCSLLSMTSCASNAREGKTNNNDVEATDMKTEGKKLVVFFSHTGENYNVGYICLLYTI